VTKMTEKPQENPPGRFELWLNDAIDGGLTFVSAFYYDPLERLSRAMPAWLFILTMPLVAIAYGLPPVLIGLVMLVPEATLVYGVMRLVGAA
jgi:hypothetical protein